MDDQSKITVVVDSHTRLCLCAITALLAVLVLAVWVQAPSSSTAYAAEQPQGFDAAAQRKAIVEAQQETNRKLGELIDLLRSGQMKVQLADDAKTGARGETASRPK